MSVVINGTTGVTSPLYQVTGCIFENAQTISSNYTISTNYNAISAGTITVATGVVVTIPTGSRWAIV